MMADQKERRWSRGGPGNADRQAPTQAGQADYPAKQTVYAGPFSELYAEYGLDPTNANHQALFRRARSLASREEIPLSDALSYVTSVYMDESGMERDSMGGQLDQVTKISKVLESAMKIEDDLNRAGDKAAIFIPALVESIREQGTFDPVKRQEEESRRRSENRRAYMEDMEFFDELQERRAARKAAVAPKEDAESSKKMDTVLSAVQKLLEDKDSKEKQQMNEVLKSLSDGQSKIADALQGKTTAGGTVSQNALVEINKITKESIDNLDAISTLFGQPKISEQLAKARSTPPEISESTAMDVLKKKNYRILEPVGPQDLSSMEERLRNEMTTAVQKAYSEGFSKAKNDMKHQKMIITTIMSGVKGIMQGVTANNSAAAKGAEQMEKAFNDVEE